MNYSIIIPVYNRPEEVKELLESLACQTYSAFEVIIVEDGSERTCREIVEQYTSRLFIAYYLKKNSGPGLSRNYGAERAKGDYLLFLDSDCVLPPLYMEKINKALSQSPADIFGGPDRADETFSLIQRAINYSMTSFLTTGGIRGGSKRMDQFYPRSFNLGIRRDIFERIGGFSSMRFGEDLDLSIRVKKAGYASAYFPELWVYHKRRTNLKQFYKQVYNSGCARITLWRKYPETLKCVHLLPALFILFCIITLSLSCFCYLYLLPLLLWVLFLFMDAWRKTKQAYVSFLAVASSFIQLTGYGAGFLYAILLFIFQGKEHIGFRKNFYE